MKSPFPGMDPYIEACGLWEDFHDDLITQIKSALAKALPSGYVARMRKRCYVEFVEADGKKRRPFVPDVGVTTAIPKGRAPKARAGGATAVGLREPVAMRAFPDEEFQEKFLDIYELRPERRLVTSIEVLSPANKRVDSVGWRKYQRKRKALLLGRASLVEIDLLRGGSRFPMLDPWPDSPYTVLVCRDDDAPHCRVWPASYDWPLPSIPVPLSSPHPDVLLELQPLIDDVYQRSHYAEEIDYAKKLKPALTADEAKLVQERLRQPTPVPRRKR